MKKTLTALFFLALSLNLSAQNNEIKFSGWKKAETEHFTFIYEDAQREATEGFIRIADEAWNKVAKIYGKPQDKTNVYVTGRTNTVNAFTYSAPTEIVMFTNPCAMTDFTFRDNWQNLFFTHELVHVANFRFEDRDQSLAKLFGPLFISLDFGNVNGWALEGLTTVLETELLNGGRGRSPYFELNYKAPTLDNGFMSYDEIGREMEPPYGQAYVMGYLIMKSIADRFGLDALADIERNRKYMGSWEESVKLVTGQTAQDIFRDVRISLAKKYADERKIPEGQIISPREINTNYYKPAIVMDDGSLIALRTAPGTSAAVVRLDPSQRAGRNYIEDTKPEEDLNTIFKETILFNGSFVDADSVTADENGKIYAVLADQRLDRAPGLELETALYSWTKEKGLKKLTKNASLFMPSVSRDGKTLIAVWQKGMKLALVKVDTENGSISPLLESRDFSFIYPAVNADGTKVSFLILDDSRAKVAVMDLNNPGNYEIVANDDEKIFDPSCPVWNKDGTLAYICNYRGRLETFEAEKDENGKWNSKPVLSDPIGVIWSYKNDMGIFYASQSSSGRVIKIKPVSEWGNAADFEGPSNSGEKISFGHLQNDYPDFKPYTLLSEVEIQEENSGKENPLSDLFNLDLKNKDSEKPVPVKGKKVKHRSEENRKAAAEANSAITVLQNEKKYIPFIQPVFYTPIFAAFEDTLKDEYYTGFGGAMVAQTPRLQLNSGFMETNILYYPKLSNFEGAFNLFIPVNHFEIDLIAIHSILNGKYKGSKVYLDSTLLKAGITIPLINQLKQNYDTYLSVFAAFTFNLNRYSTEAGSLINSTYINYPYLNVFAGSEAFIKVFGRKESYSQFSAIVTGIGNYNFNQKQFKMGTEGELGAKYSTSLFDAGALLKARYTPFSPETYITNTRTTYGGKKFDCTYPGLFIPQISMSINSAFLPGIKYKTYGEFLGKFGIKDIQGESFFNKDMMVGLEASISQRQLELAGGVSYNYKFSSFELDKDLVNLYFTFKYGWLKY